MGSSVICADSNRELSRLTSRAPLPVVDEVVGVSQGRQPHSCLSGGEIPPARMQEAALEFVLDHSHVGAYVISPLSVCISCIPPVFPSVFLFCPVILLFYGIVK